MMNRKGNQMFQNLTEIHAAIRTMSDDELTQLLKGTKEMLDKGYIELDLATEVMGIAIAHMLERSITA